MEDNKKRKAYQRIIYLKRVAFRLALVLRRGGECVDCEHDVLTELQFHHRDPEEKLFTIGTTNSVSDSRMEKVVEEADKCDLLCSRCHSRRHYEVTTEELETFIIPLANVFFDPLAKEKIVKNAYEVYKKQYGDNYNRKIPLEDRGSIENKYIQGGYNIFFS